MSDDLWSRKIPIDSDFPLSKSQVINIYGQDWALDFDTRGGAFLYPKSRQLTDEHLKKVLNFILASGIGKYASRYKFYIKDAAGVAWLRMKYS